MSFYSVFKYFILVIAILLVACRNDPVSDLDNPNSLSLGERELLGDVILGGIKNSASGYSFYEEGNFPDLYHHINELYQQVSFVQREVSGWNSNREWKVLILRSDKQIATCLPGGHFVISKGLMKLLTHEYELLYLMAFEFALMNDRDLLDEMASTVDNVADLRRIAKNQNSEDAIEIAREVFDKIIFDAQTVSLADRKTVENICENSFYKVDGLRVFWNSLSIDDQWLKTRQSDINRDDYIRNLMIELNCSESDRLKYTNLGEGYYVNTILNLLE